MTFLNYSQTTKEINNTNKRSNVFPPPSLPPSSTPYRNFLPKQSFEQDTVFCSPATFLNYSQTPNRINNTSTIKLREVTFSLFPSSTPYRIFLPKQSLEQDTVFCSPVTVLNPHKTRRINLPAPHTETSPVSRIVAKTRWPADPCRPPRHLPVEEKTK